MHFVRTVCLRIKFSIFFFSGTGNTWYIAKELQSRFLKNGHKADLFAIESPEIDDREKLKEVIEESDIIGIGFPIHNSEMSEPMKTFLENLPENLSKTVPVFSYCTQMYIGGNAGVFTEDYLVNSDSGHEDYKLKWAAHFIMPCNLHLPPIMKAPTKGKVDKIVNNEDKYLDKFADKIMNSDGWIEGGFDVVRSMFSLKFPTHKKMLYINQDKCNKCNLCYDICPVDNISKKDDVYDIISSCFFCVRCYTFCPTKAINIELEDIESTEQRAFRRYTGPIDDTDVYKLAGLKKDEN